MSIRTERVSKLVQREVADLLQGEFHEMSQSMLTVTGVRVTADLGIAYVHVSAMGETQRQREIAVKRVQEMAPQVRHALAGRVRHQMRRVPELKFFLDDSAHEAQKLDDLFAKIRADRGEDSTPEADETEEAGRGDY